MSSHEHHFPGSIPPGIRGNIRRGGLGLPTTIRIGGGGLGSLARARQRGETWVNGEQDWRKVVEQQTFRKPVREKPTLRTGLSETEEKIGWRVEVIEDYNVLGDLGILLQFSGIDLNRAPFMTGRRYYGPDVTLFYSQPTFSKKIVLLLLFTHGDIFEAQVVPKQKDVNPFFQEEIYLPQLTKAYNPRSMAVSKNGDLVVVSYKPI